MNILSLYTVISYWARKHSLHIEPVELYIKRYLTRQSVLKWLKFYFEYFQIVLDRFRKHGRSRIFKCTNLRASVIGYYDSHDQYDLGGLRCIENINPIFFFNFASRQIPENKKVFFPLYDYPVTSGTSTYTFSLPFFLLK